MTKQPLLVEDIWCYSDCPFLKFDKNEWREGKGLNAVCLFLNRDLYFYDWFVAECQKELKKEI